MREEFSPSDDDQPGNEVLINEINLQDQKSDHRTDTPTNRKTMRLTIYALVAVAAVSILAATLFLPVLQVSGTDMEPTLEDKDIVVLLQVGNLKHGDLIAFYYQNRLLIKRVIGVPGDTVDIDEDGYVSVNGEKQDEPYITNRALGETDLSYPYQVPEGLYFVLGDNRETAIDSRNSEIGCIEMDQVLGKVRVCIWPLNHLSFIS